MQINKAILDNDWKTFDIMGRFYYTSFAFCWWPPFFFARANIKQAHLITSIIQELCKNSGQSISIHKLVAFTGPGVTREMKSKISNITGIKFTKSSGNYLGFPLINNRTSKRTFNYIVEKVQVRLTGWKAKNLVWLVGVRWLTWCWRVSPRTLCKLFGFLKILAMLSISLI